MEDPNNTQTAKTGGSGGDSEEALKVEDNNNNRNETAFPTDDTSHSANLHIHEADNEGAAEVQQDHADIKNDADTSVAADQEDAVVVEAEKAAVTVEAALTTTTPTTTPTPVPPPPNNENNSSGTTEDSNNNNNTVEPMSRDCILGQGSAGHAMNELLHDFVRLERILWKLQKRPLPTSHQDVQDACNKLMAVIQKGKPLELAGLKDVPRPFLRSQGRFLSRSAEDAQKFTIMDDEQVRAALCDLLLQELKKEDDFNFDVTPYKDLKEMMERSKEMAAAAESASPDGTGNPNIVMVPDPKDAILLRRGASNADKLYETHAGNKFVFSLISQLVSTFTNSCQLRVEAALNLMQGLQDNTTEPAEGDGTATSATSNQKPRFLLRNIREDESVFWSVLEPADIGLFAICFVFEVYLEKEIHLQNPQPCSIVLKDATPVYVDHSASVAVSNPTDLDVLFGRGGMTNAHPGNRRFRDVIALHRPDYIRALKMDKPTVARKIVNAIRRTGRFLKKFEDGKWRDVGDRVASEKTSQGLRERSNAEKRQRSALREALRIRRQDLEDEPDDNKKEEASSNSKPEEIPEERPNKKQKTETPAVAVAAAAAAAPAHNISILNYSGTNLAVPLSLGMKDSGSGKRRKSSTAPGSTGTLEPFTEGLPPNAVDEEGNILVTDFDILCGRGGLTNHHKGNKRFRDIVALHRPDYMRAPKIQKPSVARVIVKAIRNGDPPGRFLRKDEKSGKWVDIGDKKASEKTSQALREKTNEDRDKMKRDIEALGQQTGVLLPNPTTYLNSSTVNAFAMASVLPTTGESKPPAVAADHKDIVAKEEVKEDQNGKLPDSNEESTSAAVAGPLNPVVPAPVAMETEPEAAKDAQEASAKDAEAIVELITGDGVPTNVETSVGSSLAATTTVQEEGTTSAEATAAETHEADETKEQAVNQPLESAGGATEEHKDDMFFAFV